VSSLKGEIEKKNMHYRKKEPRDAIGRNSKRNRVMNTSFALHPQGKILNTFSYTCFFVL